MDGSRKIILPLVITVFLSATISYFLFKWLEGYSIDPLIKNSVSKGPIIKLFITWLIYFFSLITLPFLWKELIEWIKIKEKDWWKAPLILELFSLIFSYLATPPDFISTILFFIACQPIVIVNSIILKRKLTKINGDGL
ncbi:hypothetical protein [Aquimarina sp. 2304DJ70-9]|uniref:hypothetical protein n=1 Tax=Aquimarina penaris TaxID=3231044 RepID=UPI0034626EAC